jgi:ferredoxin-NADP reductase
MSACAFYHSGIFVVTVVSILWGGDMMIRKIIMMWRYPRKATVKRLTDSIIEISLPKTKHLDYNAGQYMFITIPELSIFQCHPISISSSPYQQNITFHVRKRGYWTSALYDLAGKKKEITIWLEGPYGSSSVDLTSNRYKMAMFLSGGIGVTPMQSICHQMLYEHEWGERNLKKLWFIWTARDPAVMSSMDVVNKHSDSIVLENTPKDELTSVSSAESKIKDSASLPDMSVITTRVLTDMPVSHTPDDELEVEFPIDDFVEDEEVEEEGDSKEEKWQWPIDFHDDMHENDEENQFQNSAKEGNSDMNLHQEDMHLANPDEVLSLDCYLTAKEMKDAGIVGMPFVQQGRPDMKKIFLSMREEAIKAGEKRVAVCVCAPKRLVQICKMACTKYSNRKVRFDFHSEVFD